MEHAGTAAPALLLALQHSALAQAIRRSLVLYPAIETLHILGFSVLVGAIVAFDLRLLTAAEDFDVEGWVRLLIPVAAGGLALAVPMGCLLFTTEATAYVRNPAFLTKMALVGLAIANLLWFHHGPARIRRRIGPSIGLPPGLRLSAGLSMLCWIAVLVCGRLIAYL